MSSPREPSDRSALRPEEVLIDLDAPGAGAELATLRSEGTALELEIGTGKGRFLLAAADRWPRRAFLGLERSRPLAATVARRAARAGLRNVRVASADARAAVARLPEASLRRVHVYCPDPWPKRRHAKHRLFAPPFADHLARALEPEASLLFSTDHDPYFREVVARLAAHAAFVRCTPEEPFAEIPAGGFDAIFAAAHVPVFRGAWQRVRTRS